MKQQVSPAIVVVAIAIVVALAGFFIYRQTSTPAPQAMGPQGPGMAALKKRGGDMTSVMTPAERAMMHGSNPNAALPAGH